VDCTCVAQTAVTVGGGGGGQLQYCGGGGAYSMLSALQHGCTTPWSYDPTPPACNLQPLDPCTHVAHPPTPYRPLPPTVHVKPEAPPLRMTGNRSDCRTACRELAGDVDVSILSRVLQLRPCVCLCLFLSHVSVLSKRLDGSSWFLARTFPVSCPTLRYKETQVSLKMRALSSGILSQTL